MDKIMTKYLNISPKSLLNGLLDLRKFTFVQNGCIIKFKEHVLTMRYHPNLKATDWKIFSSNSDILWGELLNLLNYSSEKYIYVSSYEGNWQPGNLFDSDKLGEGQYVMQTNNKKVLREIFNMSLEYRTFPVLATEDLSLAVVPTDHLDLFVVYSNSHKINPYIMNEDLERIEWQQPIT